MVKRGSSNPELIDSGRNKTLAKQDAKGRLKEMGNGERQSLGADQRRTAKTKCGPPGQLGDEGDRPRAAVKKR